MKRFFYCISVIVLCCICSCKEQSKNRFINPFTVPVNTEKGAIPSIQEHPSELSTNAIETNGAIINRAGITCDGPLADIYAPGGLSNKNNSSLTGEVTSTNNGSSSTNQYCSSQAFQDALKELGSDYSAYHLTSDGRILSINNGEEQEIQTSDLLRKGSRFENGAWIIEGADITLEKNLIVDTNLTLNANKCSSKAPFIIDGNFISNSELRIDPGNPFSAVLITAGNASLNRTSIVGRIQIGGKLHIRQTLDIIGTVHTCGDIVVDGPLKINYLDTVYKAAIQASMEMLSEDNLLVHSQVFKDITGTKNTVTLFTFHKGYTKLFEETIFYDMYNKTLKNEEYMSILTGASSDFGSTLAQYNGVSPYYYNKIMLLLNFEKKDILGARIRESFFLSPDRLYHTFEDHEGNTIGTYQLSGNGVLYSEESDPAAITAEQLEEMKKNYLENDAAVKKMEQNQSGSFEGTPKMNELQEQIKKRKETDEQIHLLEYSEKAEEGSEDDSTIESISMKSDENKTPGQMRNDEWRSWKDVEMEQVTVDGETVSIEESTSSAMASSVKNSTYKLLGFKLPSLPKLKLPKLSSLLKGIKIKIPIKIKLPKIKIKDFKLPSLKDLKKQIRKLTKNFFKTDWRIWFVKGVDLSPNDLWSRDIAVLNQGIGVGQGRCGQVSAAMILRYFGHPEILNAGNLYFNTDGSTATAEERRFPLDGPSTNRTLRSILDTLTLSTNDMYQANYFHNLEELITAVIIKSGNSGKAIYYDDLVTQVHEFQLFRKVKMDMMFQIIINSIHMNRPTIIGLHDTRIAFGHAMPVIGYKYSIKRKALFNKLSLMTDQYIYTHTTWPLHGGPSEFADKVWIRFDSHIDGHQTYELLEIHFGKLLDNVFQNTQPAPSPNIIEENTPKLLGYSLDRCGNNNSVRVKLNYDRSLQTAHLYETKPSIFVENLYTACDTDSTCSIEHPEQVHPEFANCFLVCDFFLHDRQTCLEYCFDQYPTTPAWIEYYPCSEYKCENDGYQLINFQFKEALNDRQTLVFEADQELIPTKEGSDYWNITISDRNPADLSYKFQVFDSNGILAERPEYSSDQPNISNGCE